MGRCGPRPPDAGVDCIQDFPEQTRERFQLVRIQILNQLAECLVGRVQQFGGCLSARVRQFDGDGPSGTGLTRHHAALDQAVHHPRCRRLTQSDALASPVTDSPGCAANVTRAALALSLTSAAPRISEKARSVTFNAVAPKRLADFVFISHRIARLCTLATPRAATDWGTPQRGGDLRPLRGHGKLTTTASCSNPSSAA